MGQAGYGQARRSAFGAKAATPAPWRLDSLRSLVAGADFAFAQFGHDLIGPDRLANHSCGTRVVLIDLVYADRHAEGTINRGVSARSRAPFRQLRPRRRALFLEGGLEHQVPDFVGILRQIEQLLVLELRPVHVLPVALDDTL